MYQTMLTFLPYAAAAEYPGAVALLQFALASRAQCGADAALLQRLRQVLRSTMLWASAAPLAVNAWVATSAFSDAHRALAKAQIPAETRDLSPKQRAMEAISLLLPIPQLLGPAVRVVRGVHFATVRGADLKLDVFLPRDARPGDRRPVFLYIHGGGWITGHRSIASLPLLFGLADRGAVCFTLNYRLAPKFRYPAGLHDSKRALAWVRRYAARFGGDPSCILVGGESAGGHLALMVALSAGEARARPDDVPAALDTPLQGCVDLYGVVDLMDAQRHMEVLDSTPKVMEKYLRNVVFSRKYEFGSDEFRFHSPVHRIETVDPLTVPPILIAHGTHDCLVPIETARDFFYALQRMREVAPPAAVQDVLLEVPGANHAYNYLPSLRTLALNLAVGSFMAAVQQNCRQGSPKARL